MAPKKKTPIAAKRILPGSKADLLERFKDYPGIQAYSRAYDSPEGPGSLPILLKDEDQDACVNTAHQNALPLMAVRCRLCGRPARKWYLRHINTKQAGRVAQVRAKGLIPVRLDELLRKDEISDLVAESADGLVHTGVSGAKMLYKIPLDLYNERKRRERDVRESRRAKPKQMREDLANEAGGAFGSEAGDIVHNELEYSARKVRTTLGDELSGMGVDD